MSTTIVNTHDAKSRLSELLRLVENGDEVIIARAGKQIARIVPIGRASVRTAGALRGQITIHAGFDDPDDVADLFDGAADQAPW
jgi:prevent-host-death family protein